MGFDGTPRNSYDRDKVNDSVDDRRDHDSRSYPRKSPGDRREFHDRREYDDSYDNINYYRGGPYYDSGQNKRYYQDDYRQRAYGRDEFDSHSNFIGSFHDKSEENSEHQEPHRSYKMDEMLHARNYKANEDGFSRDYRGNESSSSRDNRSHYSSDRSLEEGEARWDEYYRRPGYSETRSDESKYQKVSDLDYISRGDNARKYGAYGRSEDSYKRQRVDYRGSPYESPSFKSTKPKHIPADPNNTLGIFGLNQFTTEDELRTLLAAKLPGVEGYSFKLIVDEKTGLCKGFCFVDFVCLNDAVSAKDILNSESFRGQDFKCDYSYKHGIMGD